ncbi:zinc-binding alcohol dehydrogenase family protein [Agrobacterium sp. SHOUNA12C]|uniref:Oxidoreductase n=1 Tax=Rhizobium rhizogenes NBRC 13257 TaxID=1220581 RepID=A0AA87Q9B2_RHIRH|nr:zinc-binding alcohol dehydrogenase family protein [Rhizobium rhizogenes]MCJ9723000.1 zinc-binding alcohol dehydrogenase family protein [Agrobacterium sp. BETTINA12B]MCJ9758376.1 zinc-binding alcohol dehydrogenase family protein [Agrobacterium sp. SHOUNA12C]NTF58255.1 zinc-binding alcohol dehydrogenase family protein [Rhizobium rhizogenes]NTF64667.1 zinc-binding alcohol dehydrogenase family protein [Rhizobium rhizogenes]NTF77837.1 zinc-binding alcohol dehydrogenase family protein [Rhizobium 
MKAAIVRGAGQQPAYEDFEKPALSAGENLVHVSAAAISQIVKSRASGAHYSSANQFPFVVGIDGVGRLEDGRRVYFVLPRAPYGSMADVAPVPSNRCIALPDDLDDVTAAAIANPGMSSWAAFRERARLEPGETVLINGATGTSGRLAIQIAKYRGAAKVIATGRNADSLKALERLGADVTIPLTQDKPTLEAAFKEQFAGGVDVVLDYLWGESAESLLSSAAKAGKDAVPIRYVQIGAISGADISLPGAVLRSSAITLMGSGIGSISLDRLVNAIAELFQATVPGGFEIATTIAPLSEVEKAWPLDDSNRRTVFTIGN